MLRNTPSNSLLSRRPGDAVVSWSRAVPVLVLGLGTIFFAISTILAQTVLAQTGEPPPAPLSPPAPPSIPSPFLRLYTIVFFSLIAFVLQRLFTKNPDHRMAMRHGMAGGFILSGIDHFVNTQTVYVPMLPNFLLSEAVPVVYGSGIAELFGAVGLVMPQSVYKAVGVPNMRKVVGVCVALMLGCLMVANVDIAIKATLGKHYAFAVWTYWLRLLFQPLFMLWALYSTCVIAAPSLDSVSMKLFLLDQQKHLDRFFPIFKPLAMSYDAHTALREKVTSLVIPTDSKVTDLSKYNLEFLFDYVVFPPDIMKFSSEWHKEGRAMRKGDIIIQQASVPPLPISLKAVFAVRVVEIFRSPTKVGFNYGTLKGHAEMGISEFYFSIQDGVLRINIHTYSAPGTILTRMIAPFFTLPYQQYCTNRALKHMREAFLSANR